MTQSVVGNPRLWEAIAIGILVLTSTFIAFRLAFPKNDRVLRRASVVFAGVSGFLVSLYLFENPALLERYALEIVIGLLSIVVVLIAFLRRMFR